MYKLCNILSDQKFTRIFYSRECIIWSVFSFSCFCYCENCYIILFFMQFICAVFYSRFSAFPAPEDKKRTGHPPGAHKLSKKWPKPLFRGRCAQGGPRFLTEKSVRLGREVSFPRRMSPEMTDFHLIPAASAAGTLRGFPFGKVFRYAVRYHSIPFRAATPLSKGWRIFFISVM